jgi:hypothetical protein
MVNMELSARELDGQVVVARRAAVALPAESPVFLAAT